MTAGASRRERLRLETTAEIKQHAWELMAEEGPLALSLRAVARAMGMAPSALYRYFPSRNDLLTALIVDGYDSLAVHLHEAYERAHSGAEPLDAHDTFLAVAKAYRQWALDNPTEFGLIFSSSIPDYAGNDLTTAASRRTTEPLLQVMADMVAEGTVDLDGVAARIPAELMTRLAGWSDHDGYGLPPAALGAAMWCYITLHGAITLEVNKHLPPILLGNPALFESAVRDVARRISAT